MEIKLTFSVNELNIVLNALAGRPYAEVAELIGRITAEGEKQVAEQGAME